MKDIPSCLIAKLCEGLIYYSHEINNWNLGSSDTVKKLRLVNGLEVYLMFQDIKIFRARYEATEG